jgi:hypothetical protein
MIDTEKVTDRSKRGIEWLTRGSYLAKALLYGTVGLFAFNLAMGSRGPDPGRKEVLEQLTTTLFGKILIALIALALAGHTLWRLAEIRYDPYEKGTGFGGWLYRLNYLLSAITYGSLGYTAINLLVGKGGGQGNQKQIWVARLLQIDGGDWLIILVGSILILWAGLQLFKGVTGNVYKSLELDGVHPVGKGFLRVCCFVGFFAVGGILASTGWYLIRGAWDKNPKWVKNMDDLIKALQAFPGGWWLQVAIAVALILMAVFMLAMARYFPVKTTR